jgi:N6-adenosine-specific RNA methylase IME4
MLGESPLGPAVQGGKFGCRTDLFQDGEGAIGVGFYFRNVTEILLFGVRGKNVRTLPPGRTQVNYLATRKREHSRKPDEQYKLIEACSPGPFLELFARGIRRGWECWGAEANGDYEPTWATYKSAQNISAIPSITLDEAVALGQ